MTYLDNVDIRDLKELLVKGWMTHDAMWFYHSLKETGIETTNRVNLAAVRAMAGIEIQRMKRFFGLPPEQGLGSFEELEAFFEKTMEAVMPKFMKFSYRFLQPDMVHVAWQSGECFAYKGIKGLGVIEHYRCGVMPRVETWFDGLGLTYTAEPAMTGCMMHAQGECWRKYRFRF
jgi:hypothetical protein